jgi:hypothetical protein
MYSFMFTYRPMLSTEEISTILRDKSDHQIEFRQNMNILAVRFKANQR